MKSMKLGRKAAKDYIDRLEGDSKSLIKHYFDEDWSDARLYDLVINMGKTSVEEAVETIIDSLKRKVQ
jgi:cytidylate kinase